MTTLIRRSSTPPGPDRERFLARFLAAGNALRPPSDRHATAGEAYTRQVLELLGAGDSELWLAVDCGEAVARAAVSASSVEPDAALLGLYEAVEGPAGDAATGQMVEEAAAWAAERGRSDLFAPVDGNSWMAYRFRLPAEGPGPDGRQPWEPTHPAAYLRRFRALGFEDALRFETVGLVFRDAGPYRLSDARDQTAPAAVAARESGFRLERLRDHRDAVPFPELHRLSSDAFRENPLYEPLPLETFRSLYAPALDDDAADYTGWLRGPRGRIVAVVFAFRQGPAVVVKSIAVDPIHRGRHLSTALIHHMLVEAVRTGLSQVVSALVREGNASEFLSRRHLMPGVETWFRRYAVLRREVAR